jgi:hypothetical protein
MTDKNGLTMTTTDQQRELAPQQPDPRGANQAHAAEQRQSAAHVGHAVAVARSERIRAHHLGADSRRLEDAFDILAQQINGREDMTVLRPGNVLRHDAGSPEQGTADVAAVCEFVDRIIKGELPHEALEEMHAARLDRHLAPAVRYAESMYQRAHRLDHAATVQPALPAGAVLQPPVGVPLPRREPIVPQPPEFPPAPPESPLEQTGAIALKAVASLRKAGEKTEKSEAALAQLNGGKGPDFGPPPDPRFGAASVLPQAQHTQRMPRIEETQAYSPFFDDEESAEPAGDGTSGPRPFKVPGYAPEATDGPAASSARSADAASGSGDDDA